jgi:hypothetical protein
MKGILYATALILSFTSAAVAQTTSSGGSAGNQPGTNMSNTYHNGPGASPTAGVSRIHCSKGNDSMVNGSMNSGSMGQGTTGTGPGTTSDCTNPGASSGSMSGSTSK